MFILSMIPYCFLPCTFHRLYFRHCESNLSKMNDRYNWIAKTISFRHPQDVKKCFIEKPLIENLKITFEYPMREKQSEMRFRRFLAQLKRFFESELASQMIKRLEFNIKPQGWHSSEELSEHILSLIFSLTLCPSVSLSVICTSPNAKFNPDSTDFNRRFIRTCMKLNVRAFSLKYNVRAFFHRELFEILSAAPALLPVTSLKLCFDFHPQDHVLRQIFEFVTARKIKMPRLEFRT